VLLMAEIMLKRRQGVCCPEPGCDYADFQYETCPGCNTHCRGCPIIKDYCVRCRKKSIVRSIDDTYGLHIVEECIVCRQRRFILLSSENGGSELLLRRNANDKDNIV